MSKGVGRRAPSVCDGVVTPEPPDNSASHLSLQVHVVFTNWIGTKAALRMAGEWVRGLDARIVVWFPQVVPRQFPMTKPPVSSVFAERRLGSMALEYCEDAEISLQMCYCTNLRRCLANVLGPDSVVLVGGKKRWWRSTEQKLAGFLKSCGHRVLFISTEEKSPVTPGTAARISN